MNVIIDNFYEKVIFCVTGIEENLHTIEDYIETLNKLGLTTRRVGRLTGTENYVIEITCLKESYEEVLILLKNFISEH